MGIEINFAQGADPTKFTTADWSRAFRKAPVTPTASSVTPNELATSTTALIDSTAQAAASSAASAAQSASIAAATGLANSAQTGAETTAASLAASAQTAAIASASAALSAHASDSGNPHSAAGYLKQAQTDALYQPLTLTLTNAANDAAAAGAGVAIGHLYRNGSIVMIRVT